MVDQHLWILLCCCSPYSHCCLCHLHRHDRRHKRWQWKAQIGKTTCIHNTWYHITCGPLFLSHFLGHVPLYSYISIPRKGLRNKPATEASIRVNVSFCVCRFCTHFLLFWSLFCAQIRRLPSVRLNLTADFLLCCGSVSALLWSYTSHLQEPFWWIRQSSEIRRGEPIGKRSTKIQQAVRTWWVSFISKHCILAKCLMELSSLY